MNVIEHMSRKILGMRTHLPGIAAHASYDTAGKRLVGRSNDLENRDGRAFLSAKDAKLGS